MLIPTYSQEGKLALSMLAKSAYRGFIYFEDEDAEVFYEEIVKKLTLHPHRFRIICLSGKDSLISHCLDKNNTANEKSIYVLDKDFDDHLGKVIEHERLHYLERYSIENYLYEKQAVLSIAKEEKPKLKDQLEVTLSIETFDEAISNPILELASLFFVAQKYDLGITNCGDPVARYTSEKTPWIISEEKLKQYKEDISALLILNGNVNTELDLETLLNDAKISMSTHDIPGKHLVNLLRDYFCSRMKTRGIDMHSFCFRLAKFCEFNSLEDLKTKIQTIP